MLYLDHAATSHPKPPAVLAAMAHWYEDLGVSASRGSSARCSEVAAIVGRARAGMGRLCGMPSDRVAFTSGTTESINLFLRAWLRPGDRVLTTAFEHASVARPLTALARERNLALEVIAPDARGNLDLAAARTAIARRPRLFVFTHGSNVTGTLLPAAELCALARAAGTTTLLDASQTMGLVRVDVGADAVAASAHKALLGPPGLGVLAVRADLELTPQKQGGTGSSRALDEQPTTWPEAFEPGTPNTPAICGLEAALRLHQQQPPGAAIAAALAATAALRDAIAGIPGCRVIAAGDGGVPLFSFVHEQLDPADLGAMFDQHDIHVRTGHHCAPWIHRHLGTEAAGTVRISPGTSVSADDIRRVRATLGAP